jgi:hypothetical protein
MNTREMCESIHRGILKEEIENRAYVRKRASPTRSSEFVEEYQLKAVSLFNFAKLIEGPLGAFADLQSPFTICVFGKDPFGSSLDDALANKNIGDRPIVIQRPKDKTELWNGHMVFVSSSSTKRIANIVGSLQETNVLLVGDSPRFAESGGTIGLTLEGNYVRFTINTDAADRASLKISSRLIALAKIVHDREHSNGG